MNNCVEASQERIRSEAVPTQAQTPKQEREFDRAKIDALLNKRDPASSSLDDVSAPPATTEEGRSIQWDPKKSIQNARFDRAISSMHLCAREAATAALMTEVRNREQIGSAVISLCKGQLAFLGSEAKAAGISSEDMPNFAMSLFYSEIDAVISSGR